MSNGSEQAERAGLGQITDHHQTGIGKIPIIPCSTPQNPACSATDFFLAMFNPDRRFNVVAVEDPNELARKLTRQTWTGCTGFQHAGYLFLNDSTGPDGAQEFAVFKKEPEASGKYVQIEGVTFGWMGAAEALQTIRGIARGEYDNVMCVEHDLTIESPRYHGRCRHCA